MQIGSVVWEEFLHIHTYIYTHGIGLSIRVTLNTKPALQVLITEQVSKVIRQKAASPTCHPLRRRIGSSDLDRRLYMLPGPT